MIRTQLFGILFIKIIEQLRSEKNSNICCLFCRAILDGMGSGIEVAKYTEKLVPSTRFVAVDGVAPAVSGANNFVAPSASVIGKVSIGEHSR